MPDILQIHPEDNVAVAMALLKQGTTLQTPVGPVTTASEVPAGHKLALAAMPAGANIIKYGHAIGHAKQDIAAGEWVHTHNLATNLSETAGYEYHPVPSALPPQPAPSFMGYARADGRVGVRNEIWVLPTVGCVNDVATKLAAVATPLVEGTGIEGVYAFPHPYGCSQMGDDHLTTQRLLAALAHHPNAGGVLVVGLGCENNTMQQFRAALGNVDETRFRFLVCQDVADEIAEGEALLRELVAVAANDTRTSQPASKLVVGMKCGGSDGLSGITANPTVGALCDKVVAFGGSAILTEVPEMFGAEDVLMRRAESRAVYNAIVDMVSDFKQYFVSHGQTVYENPSPGNKQGGISTLEDKSLGCVQKGGSAPVVDVIRYAEGVTKPGLTLLSGPGNDLVSATALAAAGSHLILFTTGRGTPFGAPVPTIKIASNTALFQHKANWLDFNAGPVADGEPVPDAANRLLTLVLQTASGEVHTKAEAAGMRGIAIFKDGVTL